MTSANYLSHYHSGATWNSIFQRQFRHSPHECKLMVRESQRRHLSLLLLFHLELWPRKTHTLKVILYKLFFKGLPLNGWIAFEGLGGLQVLIGPPTLLGPQPLSSAFVHVAYYTSSSRPPRTGRRWQIEQSELQGSLAPREFSFFF